MAIGTPSVGTAVQAAAGSTTTIVWPTTAAGDYALLLGSVRTLGTTSVTSPSPFTQLIQRSVNADTGAPIVYAGGGFCTGTEGGTNLVITHGATGANAFQLIAFSGVDATTPIDVSPVVFSDSGGNVAALPLASITTTMAGCTLVAVGGVNLTTATATPPASFTETADRPSGTTSWETSYLQGVAQGATGVKTITWSLATARSGGFLLALRPAGPASPRLRNVYLPKPAIPPSFLR